MKQRIRKHFALVMAVMMLLSLDVTNVIAVNAGDADICTEIGMIEGVGNGVTAEYLATKPLRYQSAVLSLRLKGLEDEMLAFDYIGKDTFADAGNQSAYIQRLLAYLKANPELGWVGYAEGTFKPLDKVTVQAYTKVMLESLGYKEDVDFEWNDVFDFAIQKGINQYRNNISSFDIEDLCSITVETLATEMKKGNTLVDYLISEGVVNRTVAENVGLVEKTLIEVDTKVLSLSKIKLEFNKQVDDLKIADVKVKVDGYSKTVTNVNLALDGKSAVCDVYGLDFLKTLDITINNVVSEGISIGTISDSMTIPTAGEVFELKLMVADSDATLKSDGLTKTSLTAQLVQKEDNSLVNLNANVVFTATKGSISESEVTMVGGQATTTLTSALTSTEMIGYIVVTIAGAPAAEYFEGFQKQIEVKYSPNETVDPEAGNVRVLSAQSQQADRLTVVYDGSVNASDYKAALVTAAGALSWVSIAGTEDATLTINNQPVPVADIIQIGSTKLEFVLQTGTSGSGKPTTTKIEPGFIAGPSNYLADNTTNVLSYPKNIGNLIIANPTGVQFSVVDISVPYSLGVYDSNQIEVKVKYSEAVAEDDVEIYRGSVSSTFAIDGESVYLTASPDGATTTEKALAIQKHYILANELYVGDYNSETGTSETDTVIIKLDRSETLSAAGHSIIVDTTKDWAGLTDTVNKSIRNVFTFTVSVDSTKPTASVVKQSAEQYLIEFTEKIYFNNDIDDAIKFYRADEVQVPLVQDVDESYTYAVEDYIITDISTDEKTILLVEMIKDWTEYYSSTSTGDTYHATKHNPYSIAFKENQITDIVGNAMVETWADVKIYNDYFAPTVLTVRDVSAIDPEITPGTQVEVTFDEPVQVLDASGNPSTVKLTPSEQQTTVAKNSPYDEESVPQPKFVFRNGSDSVTGVIINGSIAEDDMSFRVKPVVTLTPGSWTLEMSKVTDDVGNMMETKAYSVTVATEGELATGTYVVWAGFDNAGGQSSNDKDYLYVKFSGVMSSDDANSVSRATNYTLNGAPLPAGSLVQVGIEGITNGWDGVTIVMPSDAHQLYTEDDCSLILKLASTFKSTSNELLSSPYELPLQDTSTSGSTYVNNDGVGSNGTGRLDAIYINDGENGLLAGNISGNAIILSAVALDNDTDGGIDMLNVVLSSPVQVDGNEELLVGGKTFVNISSGLTSTLTFRYLTDDMNTTATTGLSILGDDNSIMIAEGALEDKANPVLMSATIEVGTVNIRLVFSEPVQHTYGGSLGIYDFIYNNSNSGNGAGPITNMLMSTSSTYSMQISSPTSNLDRNMDSIVPIAGNISDMAGNHVAQSTVLLD